MEQIIMDAWKDERIYAAFRRFYKKRFRMDLNQADWKEREDGEPHPMFRYWILEGGVSRKKHS